MKKRTLVNWVLIILLMLGTTRSQAMADEDVMFANWENPMTGQFVKFVGNQITINLFQDRSLRVNLGVIVANINDLNNHRPLYIQYSFGGYAGEIGPFDNSSGFEFEPYQLENGEAAYRAMINQRFLFMSECDAISPEEIFELPVTISLVTLDRFGDFVLYPVLEHPALFPLDWFRQTSIPPAPPSFSDLKYANCGPYVGSDVRSEQTRDLISNKAPSIDSEISPNPFNKEFSLRYELETASSFDIRLMDGMGKTIYSKRYALKEAGLHEEFIRLEELVPGFYVMQLITPEKTKTLKLLNN